MDRLRALAAAATGGVPASFWEWAGASFSLGDVISTSGLLTIVALLYTGRLIPIGQHRRELQVQEKYYEGRIADQKTYYEARLSEVSESRDYYRDARLEEKTRGDKLTDQLAESVELSKLAVHAITSLDEAANGAKS